MQSLLRQAPVRTALIAACIGLAGMSTPAFAASDLPMVAIVDTCPMRLGRDPWAAMSSCGVPRPGSLAAIPSWKAIVLTAIDPSGGRVAATLKCMSKAGVVSDVAVVSSQQSTTPKKAVARLPAPLNFDLCAGYFVKVLVDTRVEAQALMVSLSD